MQCVYEKLCRQKYCCLLFASSPGLSDHRPPPDGRWAHDWVPDEDYLWNADLCSAPATNFSFTPGSPPVASWEEVSGLFLAVVSSFVCSRFIPLSTRRCLPAPQLPGARRLPCTESAQVAPAHAPNTRSVELCIKNAVLGLELPSGLFEIKIFITVNNVLSSSITMIFIKIGLYYFCIIIL